MSTSNKPEHDLINQIKELKKKLSFMEVMRGENFDSNEFDLIKLKLELEKSRRASNNIEARHNLIYSQPYLGIVYFDDDRTIVDCNNKFVEITGYSKEKLIGHSIFNIFEDKEILTSIKKCLNGLASTFEGKYKNSAKDIKLYLRGHFLGNNSQNNLQPINAGIFEDISKIKRLEYKYNLLSQSFENISECVVISDSHNTISYVNDAFVKLYGYSKNEILGKKTKIICSLNNPKKINESVYKSKNSQEPWKGSLLNVKKDGSEFPIFLSLSTVKYADSKDYARIGVIRDISSEKKIEVELINARKKAEQSDKLKSEFLGQMSHEIRTPINVILNISNMILEDHYFDAGDEAQTSFSILESAGKRIIRTIDLILNMADIQIGAYTTSPSELDLFADTYNSFFRDFDKLANEKDLEFSWKRETNNTSVYVDCYSITQIFSNILHNSLQYTHIGEIGVIFKENKKNELVVDFIDTGIGISEDFLPNIFDSFSQEERGHTRRYEGNGLGLALTKAYCDYNNIKISIESKKGFGSTFSLTFSK